MGMDVKDYEFWSRELMHFYTDQYDVEISNVMRFDEARERVLA